jgi:hypothetical protein
VQKDTLFKYSKLFRRSSPIPLAHAWLGNRDFPDTENQPKELYLPARPGTSHFCSPSEIKEKRSADFILRGTSGKTSGQ